MKIKDKIINNFDGYKIVLEHTIKDVIKDIENASFLMSETIKNGNKIFWLGMAEVTRCTTFSCRVYWKI